MITPLVQDSPYGVLDTWLKCILKSPIEISPFESDAVFYIC